MKTLIGCSLLLILLFGGLLYADHHRFTPWGRVAAERRELTDRSWRNFDNCMRQLESLQLMSYSMGTHTGLSELATREYWTLYAECKKYRQLAARQP